MHLDQSSPVTAVEPARSAIAYFWVLALGIALVLLLVSVSLPLRYPFANDTAGYVEEVFNFLAGRGLARTRGWSDPSLDLTATPLFPPGFPLIVAALSALGIGAREAAAAAAWSAWVLLFPAVFFAVRPLFARTWPAVAVTVTAVVSPAIFDWAFQALSDGPTLLLSVVSIGALVRAAGSPSRSWRWAAVSGLAAGAAYAIRNAGIILPAVALATFAAALVFRALPARMAVERLLVWSCAAGVIVLPLLARNLRVFGAVQPYFSSMAPSDYGWLRAFRLTVWSELLDFTGSHTIAQLAWSAPWFVAVGLPLAAAMAWLSIRWWTTASAHERVAAAALISYVVLGFAMITAGRARFDWVETELTRHVMQYTWAALALVGAVVLGGATRRPGIVARAAFGALFGALLAGHVGFIVRYLDREATIAAAFSGKASYVEAAASLGRPEWILTNRIRQALSRDAALKRFVADLPAGTHIVSNFAETLSLETGRPVRPLPANAEEIAALGRVARQLGPGRSLVAVFLPNNRMLRSPDAAGWQARVRSHLGPGFRVDRETPNLLVLVHD